MQIFRRYRSRRNTFAVDGRRKIRNDDPTETVPATARVVTFPRYQHGVRVRTKPNRSNKKKPSERQKKKPIPTPPATKSSDRHRNAPANPLPGNPRTSTFTRRVPDPKQQLMTTRRRRGFVYTAYLRRDCASRQRWSDRTRARRRTYWFRFCVRTRRVRAVTGGYAAYVCGTRSARAFDAQKLLYLTRTRFSDFRGEFNTRLRRAGPVVFFFFFFTNVRWTSEHNTRVRVVREHAERSSRSESCEWI